MYIKIQNPIRYALLVNLRILGLFLLVILAIIIIFTLAAGSITVVWEQAIALFNYMKQEKGIITAGFCVVGILMIPIGIVSAFIELWQKRTQWDTPTAVYALDFGPEGITVYTRQYKQFLPYKETDFTMTGELVTIRTKNSSHAALNALTLVFGHQGQSIRVSHKLFSQKLLYQLADLHLHFKTFSFDCTLSSYDTDQQKLATFLKEQVQNQTLYGLHCYYRSHFIIILFASLFAAFGAFGVGVSSLVVFSFPAIGWILLLFSGGVLISGIIWLCHVLKDKRIARRLKQLRGH